MRIIIFMIFIFCYFFSNSQSNQETGTWSIIQLKVKTKNKWSYFMEGQVRSLAMYDRFHYWELKGGFHFKANSTLTISLGFGKYNTYNGEDNFDKPLKADEWRLWPQITLNNQFNLLKLEHRYRLEERYFSNGNVKHRFRYRLHLQYPLNKKEDWAVHGSSEIFFSPYEPYFERLRLCSGLIYKAGKSLQLQCNYMRQLDYKIFDEFGKSFIQTVAIIQL